MAERIPQSATIRVPLQAYLASDHVSVATGKTIAITISKNGGAYGNPSGGATNATEIANGSYYVDLSTTDTGTTGPLFVRGAVATVDDVIAIYSVVKATNGGFTALPDAAAEASGGLPTLSAAQASNGTINANVHRWLTGTPNALSSGRVEVLVGAVTNGAIAAASFAANALDAVWSTAARLLTGGTNIVLAKGVGVTGFNDIAATDVVSGGAITTSGGIASADAKKMNGVTITGAGTAADLWRA